MKNYYYLLSFVIINCLFISSCKEEIPQEQIDTNFNEGWLFTKGNQPNAEQLVFDDKKWEKVTLPHDWAIEGPFDSKYNARTGGLPVHGIAWYRKHFTVSKKQKGKIISIEFDGAMSNSKVWLNGHYLGERPNGYMGFSFDVSSYLNYDKENIIAVQLAPEDLAARWYSGAGIYRNVRLQYKSPIHIPQWGTYITTPNITNKKAEIVVETKIKNSTQKNSKVVLETIIKDANGKIVISKSVEIDTEKNKEIKHKTSLLLENPIKWDIEKPYLYSVISNIKQDNKIVNSYASSFGVRTIEITTNDGFLLNKKRIQLNGVCMHHDLGPLGTAVNYRATERQMQIMKSMGVNALRTSHNPPSTEMLKVCDKLGILVIVEAFDEWKIGKVPNGYNKYFDEWHETDLRDMIKRDRNHPSVIMWSIGNEILEQWKEDGWKLAKKLNDICHDEDPTRLTTAGFNEYPAPFTNKLAYQIDVVGMNYWPLAYNEIKKNNPEMIIYGSETSSMTSSRGKYHLPVSGDLDKTIGNVSSYDVVYGPPWSYPPDVEFDAQENSPFSLGEFIWTGFDYIGEPTPFGGRDNSTNGYWNDDWPSKSAHFGPVDLCGFPKDRYYLYQSQWTKKPMVHVLPHWNWKGKEGELIPVFAYTNAEEVELFINGKSFGKKRKGKDITTIPAEFHGFEKGDYKTKYRLSWKVPYQPGSLKVVASTNGNIVAVKEIKTAGEPYQIKLEADRTSIKADGKDLSFISVSVVDKNGNICPNTENLIEFDLSGVGTIAAVGNGNQRSLESFRVPYRKAYSGKCMLIVKSKNELGEIKITANSKNLKSTTILLNSH
jgi:beta-galactosidase